MAVFTVALSVLLGICYVGLPMASGEETMLVLAHPPPLIDAGVALSDIGNRLHGVNHDINTRVWNINPKGFHDQELTIQVGERLKDQKDAYEDLAEAQQRRVESEKRLNDKKSTASPRELAQLKFEYENAIASEYEARIAVQQANYNLADTQKILESGKIWWPDMPEEIPGAQAYINQKEAEMAQITNAMNADRNQLNNIINSAKQTQQDIQSIDSGHIPPQYQPSPPQGNGGGGGGNGGGPSSPQDQENALRGAMDVINSAGKDITTKYGQDLGNLANDLSQNIQGKKIRNYQDALNHFEQIRNKPNMKVNKADQQAIANALNALDKRTMGEALTRLGKAFGLADVAFKVESIYKKTEEGFRTGNWGPLFLEVEGIALSGLAARFALSFLTSALLPVAAGLALPAGVGFAAAAILTGVISSFIDGSAADAFNNLVIPGAH